MARWLRARKGRRWWLVGGAGVALLAAGLVAQTLVPARLVPWRGPPATGAVADYETGAPVQAEPGAVRLADSEGRRFGLDQFAGKVVLLNLWATWCGPCVAEMPDLDALQAELGGSEFEVVALAQERAGQSAVESFFAEHDLRHLAIYLDPELTGMRKLGPPALPTSYIIDRDGQIRGYLVGLADWESAEARALINYYL